MNSYGLVKQLFCDIENVQLSKIIPSILPIALECKDYKGYCILSWFINPISENSKTNLIQTQEILKVLLFQGIEQKDAVKVIEESKEETIEIKTLAEGEVSSHSINEIELWLTEAKDLLDSATNITQNNYQKLSSRITQMRRLYEVLRGYIISKLTFYQQVLKMPKKQESDGNGQPNISKHANINKVFIVHGHNGEIKEAVARLIEKQGIKPIILHEQANQGDTIIEKFERNSDVGCAICLFTADDIGRAKVSPNDKPRARQNVVFEAGYFIGRIGRNKVVLIADQGVEIPSDLQGVVYTDSASWQHSLLQELKAIGYNIDYNKLD